MLKNKKYKVEKVKKKPYICRRNRKPINETII